MAYIVNRYAKYRKYGVRMVPSYHIVTEIILKKSHGYLIKFASTRKIIVQKALLLISQKIHCTENFFYNLYLPYTKIKHCLQK